LDSIEEQLSTEMIPTVGDVGLLHFRTDANTKFGVKEAEEVLLWAEKIGGEGRKPFLINLSGTKQVSPKVFRHFSDELGVEHAVALAIVVDSRILAGLGRMMWGVRQPSIPMRVYTTTSEAMDWLTGRRDFE